MRIAKRVRWWRLERGMTQHQLAGLAGLAPSYISMIENGKRSLDSRSTVEALALALDVSFGDLVGQPAHPDTRDAQLAWTLVGKLRAALVSTDLAYGADIAPRPLPDVEADSEAAGVALQECDYTRSMAGLDRVIAELYAIVAAGGPDRARALALLVNSLDIALWNVRMYGHYDLGYAMATRQLQAAQELGSPEWLGMARFTHALTLSAGALGPDRIRSAARRCAEQGIDELTPHATTQHRRETLGMLLLGAMAVEVAAGQPGTEYLVEARRVAQRTGEGRFQRNFFGPTNTLIWEAQAAVDLREGGRVAEIVKQVDQRVIPSRSRYAHFWTHVGMGLAQERGRQDEAVEALLRAEQLAPGRLRLDPLARETVGHMLTSARRNAAGTHLARLARRAGVL